MFAHPPQRITHGFETASYSDVETVFLPPADARAAFEQGAVDAWAIWDPFQAAAKTAIGARTLRNGEKIVPNQQFYLGARSFVEANKQPIDALVAAISETDEWTKANPAEALEHQSYGVKPLSADVVAEQQRIADTFHDLGLIPSKISVSNAALPV